MEGGPKNHRRNTLIVGGANLVPSVAALVLAAAGQSAAAAAVGLCAAIGWLVLARSVRTGRL
jgi:hypothetical protein